MTEEAVLPENTAQSALSFRPSLLHFSLMLALGTAVILPAAASDIHADKSAPKNQQPTVLNSANGITQVNIQTPTAGGVSVNQYRRFDVDNRGVILNNSRRNVQTQLGGWIQGNPWLATGEAKVIVNQVNSANPGANVQVSATYGQQHNRNSHHSVQTEAVAADLHSGGQLTLHTTGGADSDINIIGSDVSGKGGTLLLSAGKINVLPAEQLHSERNNNRSAGGNAGVAASYGSNGWAFGVTAGGNYGKGHGNSDSTTHRHSTVGDAGSQTILQSHGKTTIKGGQVQGKGVILDAQDLDIHSVQDTATYDGKQQNIQGQITVGYGFSASGDFNKSKLNADYAGVGKQSGILAGEDGFQVRVKGHAGLEGGLISSSQSAEAAGKNQFSTGTLSHSDIENHSRYKGNSFGLGGGVSVSGES